MSVQVRMVLAGAVAAVSVSCALPQISLDSLRGGIPSPSVSVDPAAASKVAVEAEAKCAQIEQQPLGFQEEVTLGGAVALNWAQKGGGLYAELPAGKAKPDASQPKNALNLYVATVGKNLAAQSARPGLRWTFGVLDSPAVNAYSAPGGYVMVTRGLLEKVENEAQLAGVLAHEIAHINEKHALKAYQRLLAIECKKEVYQAGAKQVVQISGDPLWSSIASGVIDAAILGRFTDILVELIVNNGYEANQENGADAEAAELMTRAGYNPHEYVKFLAKIPDGPLNYSKHPSRADRQKNVSSVIAALAEDELLAANGKKLEEYAVIPNRARLAAATVEGARTQR